MTGDQLVVAISAALAGLLHRGVLSKGDCKSMWSCGVYPVM